MGKASDRRLERVRSLLLSTVSEVIRDELDDPRIGIYSFTELRLARDLTSAEFLVAAVGGKEATDECAAVLNGAANLIWNRVRSETDLRSVPRIRFTADHRGEYADQVFRTIEELRNRGEFEIATEPGEEDKENDGRDGGTEKRQSAV